MGEVVELYTEAAQALISELAVDTAKQFDVSLDDRFVDRLFSYSLSISNYKGSVKEWTWRNGWLWERSQGALHRQYLQTLGHLPS